MKALILTLTISLAALGSGAFALVHALESSISDMTISQAQPSQANPQLAQIVAML